MQLPYTASLLPINLEYFCFLLKHVEEEQEDVWLVK